LISDPIARLGQIARGVSERHDYSLRATPETGGDIRTLIDAFNQMLEQIQARTIELQRAVQARDDFLSVAAHELRNPVNAVQLQLVGVLRAAQRSAQPLTQEWVSERIGQANGQVDRLVRLLDNLLDASRIADQGIQLEVEDVDFAEIVRSVVERFEEDPRNRHVVLDASPVVGRWDRLRLEQIVTNLLSNAFKYGNGKPIVISLSADTETACLSVTDHGDGIHPEQQTRLFTRFERAVSKQRYGGFGLGLWITRSIVDVMGGQIAVDSEPGQGSTFRVELPRRFAFQEAQPVIHRAADDSQTVKAGA
jgi:signal transduction histidine kinase